VSSIGFLGFAHTETLQPEQGLGGSIGNRRIPGGFIDWLTLALNDHELIMCLYIVFVSDTFKIFLLSD
jgi:hypothetical protein